MPMNPLPPAGGPGVPAAPAGPGRKEDAVSPDSAFTAMLLALVGAQATPVMTLSGQPPAGGETGGGESAAPAAPVLGSTSETATAPAPAPAVLPEALESMLQAQRVTVQPAAVVSAMPLPTPETPGTKETAKEGVWTVEPLTGAAAQLMAPPPPVVKNEASLESPAGPALTEAPAQVIAPFMPVSDGIVAPAPADSAKAPAPIPSPIEPELLMDAIAKAAVKSDDGHYTVTLRLHPEQLGEVRLQLQIAGREVQTTLQVANPAAQQLLEQRSDMLRQSLNQSGLTLSGFHVATGQDQRQRDNQAFEQLPPRRRNRQAALAPIGIPAGGPLRLTTNRRSNGLDTLA